MQVTGFDWQGNYVSLIDTPGHVDFGGEVERVLSMVDGVVLVVCAREGPMPQTRYVLRKALERGFSPMVVFNKADREDNRLGEVETEVFDLFAALDASDEQLDFPIWYASAKEGWVTEDVSLEEKHEFGTLLDAISSHCPPPRTLEHDGLAMLVSQTSPDSFLGTSARGKVASGSVKVGDEVMLVDREGNEKEKGRVTRVGRRKGMDLEEVEEGVGGDIVEVTGLASARPTDTITSLSNPIAIPADPIDPPTLSMTFGVNDSPLVGQDGGTKLTFPLLSERLAKEAEENVAIRVEAAPPTPGIPDAKLVLGRGELQMSILIEELRREGFEFSVFPPQVLQREEVDPETKQVRKVEPWEEILMEVDSKLAGSMIEKMSLRKGDLLEYEDASAGEVQLARLRFEAPTRALLGLQAEFRQETRGEGILTRMFSRWDEVKGSVERARKGALISTAKGNVTAYALKAIEPRGTLFLEPGSPTYPGMVIGEHSRDKDLEVNPVKGKKLTNVRAAGNDDFIKLQPPRRLPLEEVISWINDEECLEVTPAAIRIRKRFLDPNQRKVMARQKK